MLPAPTLKTILEQDRPAGAGDAAGRRLVSILLATPDTASFTSLRDNVAYFHARTGDSWDLHVAGYYAYGGSGYDPLGFPVGISVGVAEWWFSPLYFNQLRHAIEQQHATHVGRLGVFRRRRAWKYSGVPQIVSMWAEGADADWDSLVAYRLTAETPLGSVVETNTEWRDSGLPADFRPGTRPRAISETLHAETLRRGLTWVAAGAAGAALTEGVNISIDELTRH